MPDISDMSVSYVDQLCRSVMSVSSVCQLCQFVMSVCYVVKDIEFIPIKYICLLLYRLIQTKRNRNFCTFCDFMKLAHRYLCANQFARCATKLLCNMNAIEHSLSIHRDINNRDLLNKLNCCILNRNKIFIKADKAKPCRRLIHIF